MAIKEQIESIINNIPLSIQNDDLIIKSMKFVQEMEQAGLLNQHRSMLINNLDLNSKQLKTLVLNSFPILCSPY